jgi:hypothetical protein
MVPARQSLLKIGLRKGPGRVVMDIPDRGFEHLPNDIKLVVEVVVTAVGDLVCVPLDEEYFPCRSCDDEKQTQGFNLAAMRPPACISFPRPREDPCPVEAEDGGRFVSWACFRPMG